MATASAGSSDIFSRFPNAMSIMSVLNCSGFSIAASAITLGGVSVYLGRKHLLCYLYDFLASLRPNPGLEYLEGNFAPVHDEVHVKDLQVVKGQVPEGLEGAYLRTGPNPHLPPAGGYHWFDGDGMIHGVKLSGGKAHSYANHLVKTARLEQEKKAGKSLFMKMGDIYGSSALIFLMLDKLKAKLRVYSNSQGAGTANTALLYHAKRILALNEGDLPYQLRILCDGLIETLGRLNIGGGSMGQPYPGPVTAHPKVDPITYEVFFFGYNFDTKPYVIAGMMDAGGALTKQWAIDLPYPAMMHDCGLTANHAIILQMPLTFDGERMMKGGLCLGFKPELGTRIGLLCRDSPGIPSHLNVKDPAVKPAEMQWFDVPPAFAFHVGNCWEDDTGLVHIILCQYEAFNFHGFNEKVKTPFPENERPVLTEYVLDPASGQTKAINKLSKLRVDFPVVHPGRACYSTRYMWGAIFDYDHQPLGSYGIAKFDFETPVDQDACIKEIHYPEGCLGGEALFVPRVAGHAQQDTDDGWLLVYVHNSQTDKSFLNIYDALTMDSTPLASVLMPRRVPYGFHGTFVSAEQLKQQKTVLG